MDGFAMQEWLSVIIGIAILAVVLDGLRRMRAGSSNSIRSAKRMSEDSYEPETFGSELPSGGARVVGQRDPSEADKLNTDVKSAYVASRKTKGFRIPEQVALSLDEPVPMLMDSVAEPKGPRKPLPKEPTLGNLEEIDQAQNPSEPSVGDLSGALADDQADAGGEFVSTGSSRPEKPPQLEPQQFDFDAGGEVEPAHQDDSEEVLPAAEALAQEPGQTLTEDAPEPAAEQPEAELPPPESDPLAVAEAAGGEPEEVFVINIMAPKGYYFAGPDLLELALEAGFRLGEMNIFHRHHRMDGTGPILFSMANIVMPGTFDLNAMDDFKSPGVSLFLALPCSARSMDAFELLYGTADYLATNLGGDLKDEDRNVLTAQTVEHYRQRIRDFERHSLMK